MQEDPYWGDGLNLYVYCKNNSVIYHLSNTPEYVSEIESIGIIKFKNLPKEIQKYLIQQNISQFIILIIDNICLGSFRRFGYD